MASPHFPLSSLSLPTATAVLTCASSLPQSSTSCMRRQSLCCNASAPSQASLRSRRCVSSLLAMASSQSNVEAKNQELSEKISRSIKDAEDACVRGLGSEECAAAWDEVEELS
eukprot:c19585_g2_i1 orf=1-336(-)